MKILFRIIPALIILASCNRSGNGGQGKEPSGALPAGKDSTVVFFPVTTFLEGQIVDIKNDGLNPVRIIKKPDGRHDSTWLPVETLPGEFAEFMKPRIDSVSMVPWFTEKTFMDETIGLVTMTYERKPACPDTLDLKEWTVYIDPETDKVSRIYILKQRGDSIFQLTWMAGKYSKMRVLDDKKSGEAAIIKDITVNWSF